MFLGSILSVMILIGKKDNSWILLPLVCHRGFYSYVVIVFIVHDFYFWLILLISMESACIYFDCIGFKMFVSVIFNLSFFLLIASLLASFRFELEV